MSAFYRFTNPLFLSPVRATFFTSLVLSAIAVSHGLIDRDGMLYTDAARTFMENGVAASVQIFNWPFLPILMGLLAQITGIPPEWCGHLMNIVFMSGACAFLVSIIQRNDNSIAWLAAMTVLATTGLNEYRGELIREYGCWFFLLCAFRLALDWPEKPGWKRAMLVQAALLPAVLFRPEALIFVPCILLWQYFHLPKAMRGSKNLLLLGAFTALFLLILVGYYSAIQSTRIAHDFTRLGFYAQFDATARNVGLALNSYAQERSSHVILFFGSISLIPWAYFFKQGLFILPLMFFLIMPERRKRLQRHDLLIWAVCCYLPLLFAFTLRYQFIAGRYIALLLIFSLPFVAYGIRDLLLRFPRLRRPVVALCVLLALANVIQLSPGKTHFREAGQWLSGQYAEKNPRLYLESPRSGFYAGWKYAERVYSVIPRANLLERIRAGHYDVVILEVSRKDQSITSWVAEAGLSEIRRFVDGSGDAIIVYAAASSLSPDASPLPRNAPKPVLPEHSPTTR